MGRETMKFFSDPEIENLEEKRHAVMTKSWDLLYYI